MKTPPRKRKKGESRPAAGARVMRGLVALVRIAESVLYTEENAGDVRTAVRTVAQGQGRAVGEAGGWPVLNIERIEKHVAALTADIPPQVLYGDGDPYILSVSLDVYGLLVCLMWDGMMRDGFCEHELQTLHRVRFRGLLVVLSPDAETTKQVVIDLVPVKGSVS